MESYKGRFEPTRFEDLTVTVDFHCHSACRFCIVQEGMNYYKGVPFELYAAAVADNRFAQFSSSYRKRFGANPYRLATLGYDAVLLSLRIAREWKPGSVFPIGKLSDKGGFLGLDGPFRFSRNGVIERALEVREIRSGTIVTVSPAPTRFED